jgi:hypothetical protein
MEDHEFVHLTQEMIPRGTDCFVIANSLQLHPLKPEAPNGPPHELSMVPPKFVQEDTK